MDRARFTPRSFKVRDRTPTAPEPCRSILLVEDEMAFAELVREHLEACGYVVTIAPDGVQGLKWVMEKDFDIILCDVLMPNLPGDMFYVAVERVKRQMSRRFIFITGHQNEPRISGFIKKVRALTLFKPFEMHQLVKAIEVTLRNTVKRK